ncbi:MAG: hypothetical protein WBP22_01580 [Candidatus Saccharimonas sp.]
MARNAQQQYTVDRFPGLGGIARAQQARDNQAAQRKAERIAQLAAARAEQIKLAETYRSAPAVRHPVAREVFDAVLARFRTAEAVEVDGRRYGAVAVAVDGVTTDEDVAEYFAEDSKVLQQALEGATWARKALVQSGKELTDRRQAEKAAREEKVSV